MSPDLKVVRSLRAYEDPQGRFRERFLVSEIGGGSTVAVLSTPLPTTTRPGWVICSSFGTEQVRLMPFETALARELAAAGFPALRFHSQGYGDSEFDGVTPGSHVRGAVDAFRLLDEAVIPGAFGLVGARFGATVAALAADMLGADMLALLDPVTKGRPYVDSLLRQARMAELLRGKRSNPPEPLEDKTIRVGGLVDVGGFSVPREVINEISSIELVSDLAAFAGRSLVIQISRSSGSNAELGRLVDRLRELGGQSILQQIVSASALKFGLPSGRRGAERQKADVQQRELQATVAHRTAAWCVQLATGRTESGNERD